jgi:hypothetical protein
MWNLAEHALVGVRKLVQFTWLGGNSSSRSMGMRRLMIAFVVLGLWLLAAVVVRIAVRRRVVARRSLVGILIA